MGFNRSHSTGADRCVALALWAAAFACWAAPASASLVVSPLIIDVAPDQPQRGDVELLNNGAERLYVVVEPHEVVDPGTPMEHRVDNPDPEALGLLATPNRVVLEPGARKFVRITLLKPVGEKDRIFRITIKPVVGAVAGQNSGLKILIGFEMLVIQRPNAPAAGLISVRRGALLSLTNQGNTNVEIFKGKQCDADLRVCMDLPSDRLYPGATVNLNVRPDFQATFTTKVQDKVGAFDSRP